MPLPRITLRPSTDEDRPFLQRVYASTREEELATAPWPEEQKRQFLEMQFQAQDMDYRARRPDAQFLVIEADGTPIGRLYRVFLDDELRVMDIALLPEWRGQGIGSALIDDIIAEADAAGLIVSLHVERWNPARRLYDRLGFDVTGETEVYLRLERPPGTARRAAGWSESASGSVGSAAGSAAGSAVSSDEAGR